MTRSIQGGWPDVLASALVGTARSGEQADALLEAAAAHALRRRAGVALVPAARPPAAAPVDDARTVGPAAAARVGDLLALDSTGREVGPVRDMASRLELLAEWLAAAAAAGRRLPTELVPALLDAGRRHRGLRVLIAPVAGPLAGWLAGQRAEWSYASTAPPAQSTVDDGQVWELGSLAQRVVYLARLRRHDPDGARELLRAAWDAEPPDDRAELLKALAPGLSGDDGPLLERALDDRRRQVREVALDLLARLPASAHAQRMAVRASACVVVGGTGRIDVTPPEQCDRSMRRDGIAPRPPAGTGERAWWLEETLARAPLHIWPQPHEFLAREVREGWVGTLRRGLARAAAIQRHGTWAAALVDSLTADVLDRGRPEDRLLLEALYDALPADDLAIRATAALRRGLAGATAVGVDHVLALCPRPWPPAVADAVLAALGDQAGQRGTGWRIAGLCELAALRLPADLAPRVPVLLDRLRAAGPASPGLVAVERLARTLRFRHDMLEELA
ncbi:MAG: hypothetical protein V7603_4221 [Micromonosporaceae bacterium]